MLQIALIAVTTRLGIGGCLALTCHCMNDAQCDPFDGSCRGGCQQGWYGPGCQFGNVAFKKRARQISTYDKYSADMAVDGIVPSDDGLTNCTHTNEITTGVLWWYVDLSDSEDFVLKNITIVNRQGANGEHLRNFYILYTSNMSILPDPTSWERCTFQKTFQETTMATYTCDNRTAIGRRVAVYLIANNDINTNEKLTLCEVFVDGYSYDSQSMLQRVTTYITPTCNGIAINFTTLPVVPPTYLVVQLRHNNENSATTAERIRNTGNGLRVVFIRTMANQMYTISVAPEICCIGSQCLDAFALDHSKCIIGNTTTPAMVKTPQYRQYALRKDGNVVTVAFVKDNLCPLTEQRITCDRSPDAQSTTGQCSKNDSCELDPRYDYTCILKASYSDGFNLTLMETFHISIADFSNVKIFEAITCNSITLVLQNYSTFWDLEPSLIEFYLSSGTNNTLVKRVSTATNGEIAATFSVVSNVTYTVWAAPITSWSINQSPDIFSGACLESRNCIIGGRTSTKVITSLKRQYSAIIRGCCVSISLNSSTQCEIPVSHMMTCAVIRNTTYEVLTNENGSICGLKTNTNYICSHTVYVRNGQLESYRQFFQIVDLPDCLPSELPKASQSTSATIGGTVVGIVIFIIVVTSVTMYLRRRKRSPHDRPLPDPMKYANKTHNKKGNVSGKIVDVKEINKMPAERRLD